MTVKGRKHVKWDPICFDNADRDDDDDGDVDENGMWLHYVTLRVAAT